MDHKKLYVIRGIRIVEQITSEQEQLDERASYRELHQKTVRGFPNTTKRQHATHPVRISQMDLIPYKGTKNLLVKGLARSGTRGMPVNYKSVLFFNDVKFEDEDAGNNVTFKASDGEDYHIQPIQLSSQVVRVRCDCLDFYFRFAPWNYTNKDLYGPKPKPYHRKTTTRPPVNPTKTPGICKHLMKLVQGLQEAGLVK